MEEKVAAEELSSVNCAATVRRSSASWAEFRSFSNTNKASERVMNCHGSFLTCCFATLHTRIVVPQFENSLMEMCHEAEVGSPFFINSLVA